MRAGVASPLIGLGIPAVALLVVMPLIADTSVAVAGIPLLFFWVFLWIPLTSVCLWVSWHFFDRHRPETPEIDTESGTH